MGNQILAPPCLSQTEGPGTRDILSLLTTEMARWTTSLDGSFPVLPDHGGLERAEGDSAGCVGRGSPGTDPSCDLVLGPALHSTVKTPPAPLRQTRLGAGKSVGTWGCKARGHCKSHRHVLQMRPRNLLSWPETQVSGGLCPLALPLAPCAVANTPSRPPVSWPMPLVPSMPQPVAPSRPATGLRALLPGPLDANSQLEGNASGPFPPGPGA